MRLKAWATIGGALLGLLLAACQQQDATSQPASSPADQAAHAAGQVAVLFKDVQTVGYDSGKATQCSILYNVYNNTGYHLYTASTEAGDYEIQISDLSANSQFKDDQTLVVDPIDGSSAGVVAKLIQAGAHLGTTTCQMEKVTEGDCQAKVMGYVSVDKSTQAKLQQADQTAIQQTNALEAQQFEQAKAQAWAQRGQFESPIGTVFATPPDASAPVSLSVVLAPDFDPTKIADPTTVATSNISFCPADPITNIPPSGTLKIVAITRDQFGLSSWYKMKLDCPDVPTEQLWIQADAFDSIIQSGAISKSI